MRPDVRLKDLPWAPHPTADGVRIKVMLSKKQDGLDLSCMLVNVPAGVEVPEHVHEEQTDIIYPLEGSAQMWIDGAGQFSLEPGMIVKVPPATRHAIKDVKEDLLVYDVFFPALL